MQARGDSAKEKPWGDKRKKLWEEPNLKGNPSFAGWHLTEIKNHFSSTYNCKKLSNAKYDNEH